MLADDRASRHFGIAVTAVGPGTATVEMTVQEHMLNGFGTCHGGVLTVLADSAFAFACNSHNTMAVAAGLSMDFLRPARAGDRLAAEAVELSCGGRSGLYDVTVRNQRGERVAAFRGRAHRFAGRAAVPLDG
ncbi:MAG: hydroxyphenylacetyl-CoA thioesterase PaaI [Xylophilus ampelinus]